MACFSVTMPDDGVGLPFMSIWGDNPMIDTDTLAAYTFQSHGDQSGHSRDLKGPYTPASFVSGGLTCPGGASGFSLFIPPIDFTAIGAAYVDPTGDVDSQILTCLDTTSKSGAGVRFNANNNTITGQTIDIAGTLYSTVSGTAIVRAPGTWFIYAFRSWTIPGPGGTSPNPVALIRSNTGQTQNTTPVTSRNDPVLELKLADSWTATPGFKGVHGPLLIQNGLLSTAQMDGKISILRTMMNSLWGIVVP